MSCGLCRNVRGNSTYEGSGIFAYLNSLTRDPPPLGSTRQQWRHTSDGDAEGAEGPPSGRHFMPGGVGRFARIPRPPVGWKGMREHALENGEPAPEGGFGRAQMPDLKHLRAAVGLAYIEVARSNGAATDAASPLMLLDRQTRETDVERLTISRSTIKSRVTRASERQPRVLSPEVCASMFAAHMLRRYAPAPA